MTFQKTARNDPCPCGSGKKYKKCCLGKQEEKPQSEAAKQFFAEFRQAMHGKEFTALEEVQTFSSDYIRQYNQSPLDDFQGLSPEQMFRFQYYPFSSPDLVVFPDVLAIEPKAPVVTLFKLLADTIGERGLKGTVKGNLPRSFCREAGLALWGEEGYRENTKYGDINKEEDFLDLHITRVVAEIAGLIRKLKGKFILTKSCRGLLAGQGMAGIYPVLFKAYTQQYNWAYADGYKEMNFIQMVFLFTMYLLAKFGNDWHPTEFYQDCFIKAFPDLVNDIEPSTVFPPEKQVRICYNLRTLHRFAVLFGLAEMKPVSDKPFELKYKVRKLPLLDEVVRFPFMRLLN